MTLPHPKSKSEVAKSKTKSTTEIFLLLFNLKIKNSGIHIFKSYQKGQNFYYTFLDKKLSVNLELGTKDGIGTKHACGEGGLP